MVLANAVDNEKHNEKQITKSINIINEKQIRVWVWDPTMVQ